MQISIADIAAAFPAYRVAAVAAEGLAIAPERPAALDALIREREAAARARWAGTELAQIPGIAAWRQAYKGFGIKQTRYRSSVERLVKNVLAGRDLARINAFVDLYNAVSLAHVLPPSRIAFTVSSDAADLSGQSCKTSVLAGFPGARTRGTLPLNSENLCGGRCRTAVLDAARQTADLRIGSHACPLLIRKRGGQPSQRPCIRSLNRIKISLYVLC